jgi:hypothetical protein
VIPDDLSAARPRHGSYRLSHDAHRGQTPRQAANEPQAPRASPHHSSSECSASGLPDWMIPPVAAFFSRRLGCQRGTKRANRSEARRDAPGGHATGQPSISRRRMLGSNVPLDVPLCKDVSLVMWKRRHKSYARTRGRGDQEISGSVDCKERPLLRRPGAQRGCMRNSHYPLQRDRM